MMCSQPHSLTFWLFPLLLLPHSHCFSLLYLKCPGISYLRAFYLECSLLKTPPDSGPHLLQALARLSPSPWASSDPSIENCNLPRPPRTLWVSHIPYTTLCLPQHFSSSNIPHDVYIHAKFVGLVFTGLELELNLGFPLTLEKETTRCNHLLTLLTEYQPRGKEGALGSGPSLSNGQVFCFFRVGISARTCCVTMEVTHVTIEGSAESLVKLRLQQGALHC